MESEVLFISREPEKTNSPEYYAIMGFNACNDGNNRNAFVIFNFMTAFIGACNILLKLTVELIDK